MFHRIPPMVSLFLALLLLPGCAGPGPAPTHPEAAKGPPVTVDAQRLGQDRSQACDRVAGSRVEPREQDRAARAAGILEGDLVAMRTTARALGVTVTFRDSNPACAPHLRAGMASKGHDVLTKTFTAASLPPRFRYLAGTVSTLTRKPDPGVVLEDPLAKRHLTPRGEPLTCDYDLMDLIAADGSRIPGESGRDLEVREKLNAALPPRGDPPRSVKRIMHGAQAEYPAYLRSRADQGRPEPPITQILRPESPLTVLDHQGRVHRLQELEDVLNYYRCHQVPLPPEWDLRPVAHPDRPPPSGS